MEFLVDKTNGILGSSYSMKGGNILVRLQYRAKAKGFLFCVSNLFSDPLTLDGMNEELQAGLRGICFGAEGRWEYTEGEEVYNFFYVSERIMDNRQGSTPISAKPGSRIQAFWIKEGTEEVYIGEEKNITLTIPVNIDVSLERTVQGRFINRQYLCNITLQCSSGVKVTDDIVYYSVDGEGTRYPIPASFFQANKKITLILPTETTGVNVIVLPKYKDIYKVRIRYS